MEVLAGPSIGLRFRHARREFREASQGRLAAQCRELGLRAPGDGPLQPVVRAELLREQELLRSKKRGIVARLRRFLRSPAVQGAAAQLRELEKTLSRRLLMMRLC